MSHHPGNPGDLGPSKAELIESLAQDARVKQEARMLPTDRKLTHEEIAGVRAHVREYLEKHNVPANEVAKKISRSASVVTQFLNATYAGNCDKIARLLNTFVEQHARGLDPGLARGFVSTRIAEDILGVCRMAQATRTVNLVYGPAGVGKSVCFRACEAGLIVGAAHIEVTEGSRNPGQFIKAWARRLNLKFGGSIGDVEDRVIDALRGSDRLQMIDEAHRLRKEAVEIVRDVHKQANVGVVLGGTYDIEANINDFHENYGQMESLVNVRYDILAQHQQTGEPLFTVDEVIRFASSMGLRLTGDAAEWLGDRIGLIPGYGGLRKAERLLWAARIIANRVEKSDRVAIDVKHLKAAMRQNEGLSHYERMEHRVKAALERRVATS